MNRKLKSFSVLLLSLLTLASCKDSDSTPDPRYNWQSRNAQWFTEVYDAAKASIAQAKAQYPNGDDWEQHCDWECQSCHYGQEWQRKHCYGWECHRLHRLQDKPAGQRRQKAW